jgi:murein DD-endopeptidase MepM/ murein hydrolase activator NlpD
MRRVRHFHRLTGIILLLALASLSCNLARAAVEATQPPLAKPTQVLRQPSPTLEAATQPPPEETEQPAQPAPTELPSPPPAETPAQPSITPGPCPEEVCIVPFQFPMERPITPPGRVNVDVSYRFGSSDHGKRDVHHGVEFLNSQGTPVLAAAAGEVVIAGDDLVTKYGLSRNFYGNLVVLQHEFTGFDQPVFTLYAHLYQINVKTGDRVETGDTVGLVGRTGAATGSHLHFEVRYGENTYAASRNPELWLRPLLDEDGQPMGAIAGRILDGQGKPVEIGNIVIERLAGAGSPPLGTYYLNTYSEARLAGLEPWQESFAVGDLPAGEYQISFTQRGMQQRIVEVRPGELTLVTFEMGE